MSTVALAVAVVALLLALAARAAARGRAAELEDARADGRRRVDNLREELEGEIAKLREMLAMRADGAPISGVMIREGRLWRDVAAPEAAELVEKGEARLVDVRSPQETEQGVVPGALLLPMSELSERAREIPRDGKPTIVYCAMGGRSAAACEYLAGEGWTGLLNLQGGIGAWSGPVEKPTGAKETR